MWIEQLPKAELNTLYQALVAAEATPRAPALRQKFTVLADRLQKEIVRRGDKELMDIPSHEIPKRIDIKEFREAGYLQEANRRFFHPLGLALEVLIGEDGTEKLGGVWDYRDDPEGVYFAKGYGADADKAARIDAAWEIHAKHRVASLGYVIQPPIKEN